MVINQIAILVILVLIVVNTTKSSATGDWEGIWNTYYRDGGGTTLILKQNGDDVTGFYTPYDGIIIGKVTDNNVLEGEWIQDDKSGEFHLNLSPDKQTFIGRYALEAWWTGERIAKEITKPEISMDNPRQAIRNFLNAGNRIVEGNFNYINDLMAYASIPDEIKHEFFLNRYLYTLEYFNLISYGVINPFLLEIKTSKETGNKIYGYTLFNDIAGLSHFLEIKEFDNQWKIIIPTESVIDELKNSLIKHKIYNPENPSSYLALSSPRDTLQTFHSEFLKWDEGGKENVFRTLETDSTHDQLIFNWGKTITAEYLKATLDRINAPKLWQAIPNRQDESIPYVYYHHPKGDIILNSKRENGKVVWQFSKDTLLGIHKLHDAIEYVPTPSNVEEYKDKTSYFKVRELIKKRAPIFMMHISIMELWQWIGFVVLLVILLLLKYINSKINEKFNKKYSVLCHSLAVALSGVVSLYYFELLGVPEYIFYYIHATIEVIITVAMMTCLFFISTIISNHFKRLSEKTTTVIDDILVNIISSITKVLIVIATIVIIAKLLGIPYEAVITGLGVSGLAFAIAARDTLSNFLGSAVILIERPFSQGDLIKIKDINGKVESVGLRSTKIRDKNNVLIVVPNILISSEIIMNRGEGKIIRE